jgi:hypothetical protein
MLYDAAPCCAVLRQVEALKAEEERVVARVTAQLRDVEGSFRALRTTEELDGAVEPTVDAVGGTCRLAAFAPATM